MTPIERHEKPDRKPPNDKAICRLALEALSSYPRLLNQLLPLKCPATTEETIYQNPTLTGGSNPSASG